MGVMLGRSMRHILRSMDTIITVTIMPIGFMLLFVYVFGGAIETGTAKYVSYLLPGTSRKPHRAKHFQSMRKKPACPSCVETAVLQF
jgi:hypothetical protein